MTDYIDRFTDEQIRELLSSAEETFREVYMSVADLPKAEWPVAKLRHLSDLKKTIGRYESEIAKRTAPPHPPTPSQVVPAAATTQPTRAARIFISYSHADEPYKDILEKHLSLLNRIGVVETWSDRALAVGQNWEAEIRSQIEKADITILLISANFLASDYCYTREAAFALEEARTRTMSIVLVILSPVQWTLAPFSSLQSLPRNAQPITTWPNQDEAWAQVADGIRRLVQSKVLAS